jgi:hypothetical protein
MSYKPFASIVMQPDGQLMTSEIPPQIKYGSWFLLTNRQINHAKNQKQHFASTTRNPSHNRRVVLLEQPSTLPRFLKVRVRSTSEENAHRSYHHDQHNHDLEYPECCCNDKKRRQAYVTKEKWLVKSDEFTINVFCCQEPDDSSLWSHI